MAPGWLLAHFKGLFGDILSVLIEARVNQDTLTLTEMTRRVYARRGSEPKNPTNSIKVAITKHRKALTGYGWWISGPMENDVGYRLLQLETHGNDSPFSRLRRSKEVSDVAPIDQPI